MKLKSRTKHEKERDLGVDSFNVPELMQTGVLQIEMKRVAENGDKGVFLEQSLYGKRVD